MGFLGYVFWESMFLGFRVLGFLSFRAFRVYGLGLFGFRGTLGFRVLGCRVWKFWVVSLDEGFRVVRVWGL